MYRCIDLCMYVLSVHICMCGHQVAAANTAAHQATEDAEHARVAVGTHCTTCGPLSNILTHCTICGPTTPHLLSNMRFFTALEFSTSLCLKV